MNFAGTSLLKSASCVIATVLFAAGCAGAPTTAATPKEPAKNAEKPAPAKAAAPAPAGLHIKSPESGGPSAKMTPGLYLNDQLLAGGITEAFFSPDHTMAVWQSGAAIEHFSMKTGKTRTIASNLPASVAFVEWQPSYLKLKLSNTSEFTIDNIE